MGEFPLDQDMARKAAVIDQAVKMGGVTIHPGRQVGFSDLGQYPKAQKQQLAEKPNGR